MEKKEFIKITREDLNVILEKHKRWLITNGEDGERADLSYTDLQGFNLTKVNLSHAGLTGSDLSAANLCRANLSYANLSGADLYCADLKYANLSAANLECSNLSCSNLSCSNLLCADLRVVDLPNANLSCANLICACLTGADLRGADLHGANLTGADLSAANLSGADADLRVADLRLANLQNTDLTDVKNFPNIPMACPETGSFTGWTYAGGYIVKLEIPADAKRSSGTGNKCRCNKAKVLSIENYDGTPVDVEVHSNYDPNIIYRFGETVTVDDFDNNRFNECAPGIHFYMNRDVAVLSEN